MFLSLDVEELSIGLGVAGVVFGVAAIVLALVLYRKTTEQVRRLAVVVFGATDRVLDEVYRLNKDYSTVEVDDADLTNYVAPTIETRFIKSGDGVQVGLEARDHPGTFVVTVRTPEGKSFQSGYLDLGGDDAAVSLKYPADFPKGSKTKAAGLYAVHWSEIEFYEVGGKQGQKSYPSVTSWFVVLP